MADVSEKERLIMVAVDEGDESIHALSWCLKNMVSRHSKDKIILVYAKPPRVVYGALDGTGYLFSADVMESVEKYNNEVAECVVDKAIGMCKEKVPEIIVEKKVENGDPRDVITAAVEKLCPDVLVMGSHGYGAIKRAFLGSVSNHCAQNVKCPVLIVKKPKAQHS